MILVVLMIVPCLLTGVTTYLVLRHFDLPLPARRSRLRLNVDASSRLFLAGAGTAMAVWILAWLGVLVLGLLKLYGL